MGAHDRYEESEPLRRSRLSGDSHSIASDNENNRHNDLDGLEDGRSSPAYHEQPSPRWRRPWTKASYISINPIGGRRRRRSLQCKICRLVSWLPYIMLSLLVICGLFFPSYTNPPQRYNDLRKRVNEHKGTPGAGNINNEKVFIAASIYEQNGELVSGQWGKAVSDLIHILGPENVFLSIYENDADLQTQSALKTYEASLPCNASLITEHLDLSSIHHVSTPDGTQRLKRIAFLAEVRNRALRPLEDKSSPAYTTVYDRVLYLNDVLFDPIDAANLLFSTAADPDTGRTNYRAACATDFIDPVKFYDRFATRDAEGYTTGVPIYPFFTSAGMGVSRKDVIAQKDAVRVKSCWGGMTAFEAKWFQSPPPPSTSTSSPPSSPNLNETMRPLRFRAETDTYWDASECCLIHADLDLLASQNPPTTTSTTNNSPASDPYDIGIYMNPHIRVAYTPLTLRLLPYTRRFERLYAPLHALISTLASLPSYNPRRLERAGDIVTDTVWTWDAASQAAIEEGEAENLSGGLRGSFRGVERTARAGQFCGGRRLLFIKETDGAVGEGEGEGVKWGNEGVPAEVEA